MMADVLGIKPTTKADGLREFSDRGFLLIDATYTPVNHDHLSDRARDALIFAAFPKLLVELSEYAGPETRVVLVKANICALFDPLLTQHGFNVVNCGTKIPFPSNGQQARFRVLVRAVLGFS